MVEALCPTFSWAGAEGARGYQLVVLAVPEGAHDLGEQAPVIATATLSPGARSWTPSLGSCLERGGRYAWSVRAMTEGGEGPWSEPALFRVATGPSAQEVESALETLRQYLEGGEVEIALPGTAERLRQRLEEPGETRPGVEQQRAAEDQERLAAIRRGAEVEAALAQPLNLVMTDAPVLGSPSLSVSANIALGPASNLFKDGAVFLWDDDASSNTAFGRDALASATGYATRNTAVGRGALQDTTEGAATHHGSYNTALGVDALRFNTTGYQNTASGFFALRSNTTGRSNTALGNSVLRFNTEGYRNTASGYNALRNNTTGRNNTANGVNALRNNSTGSRNTASGLALNNNTTGDDNTASGYAALFDNTSGQRNTALGRRAGRNATTGNDNIYLGSGAEGVAGEGNTIRIGGTTGTGVGRQNRAFIAGIHGTTVAGTGVLVGTDGQLGVASSSERFKEAIEDLGGLGERVAALRPVTFRYRSEALPDGGRQVGLLAEEVAELFPELVALDAEGRPFSVRYDLLSVLLLAELQRQELQLSELARLRRELAALRERLEAAEETGTRKPGQQRDRRRGGRGRDSP